jgi:hypothetical protein
MSNEDGHTSLSADASASSVSCSTASSSLG